MANEVDLLSEVAFWSFLLYSPHGQSEVSRRSRLWRDMVKNDTHGALRRIVERLSEDAESRTIGLLEFLEESMLVPAPRSSPMKKGALWPALRICQELAKAGLGRVIVPALERVKAVQKSAFAASGERPDAGTHFASISATTALAPEGRLLVVDDFVTKGATLLASASRLSAAYAERDIAGFALVRTRGLVREVDEVVAPCRGSIRLLPSGDVLREP